MSSPGLWAGTGRNWHLRRIIGGDGAAELRSTAISGAARTSAEDRASKGNRLIVAAPSTRPESTAAACCNRHSRCSTLHIPRFAPGGCGSGSTAVLPPEFYWGLRVDDRWEFAALDIAWVSALAAIAHCTQDALDRLVQSAAYSSSVAAQVSVSLATRWACCPKRGRASWRLQVRSARVC